MSFLKLVGSELFSGPFTIDMVRVGESTGPLSPSITAFEGRPDREGSGMSSASTLDLQDCINSIAPSTASVPEA